MTQAYLDHLTETLRDIDAEGLMKHERLLTTPQGGSIKVGAREVINLCANNYLGLADHPDLITAAQSSIGSWSRSWPGSWARTTRAFSPLALMQTAGFLSRFWGQRMRSSQTRLITLPSSTASAFAKPSATATPIPKWRIWRRS